MKKIFTFLICTCFLLGCQGDDDGNNRNPNLVELNFNIQLSAFQVLDLEIPGNAIYNANGGIRGVIVINTGSGKLAWEAADPNRIPNECSTMVIDGLSAVSQCDDGNRYNLFTGQSEGQALQFPMLSYRVTENGNVITVSN